VVAAASGGNLTAACLNRIGLALGIVGVLIIFKWGPPQPDFDEGVGRGLELDTVLKDGRKVSDIAEDVKRLKRWHTGISRFGLSLIILGFAFQLAATWLP
jgi:hypothetical protein